MAGPPIDRCGYTWPEDHEVGTPPDQQSCCWRETASTEAARCVWHTTDVEAGSIDGRTSRIRFPETVESARFEVLLDGACMSGVELQDSVNLDKVALRESDLSNAELEEVSLSEADLSFADLSGANLSGVDLTKTELQGADLPGADLSDADLSSANLDGAFLPEAILKRTRLNRSVLSEADLFGANLSYARMFYTDLSEAHLLEAELQEARVIRADAGSAEFGDADLSGASLIDSDLSEATFGGATLSEANFSQADLSRADLSGTDPSGTRFKQTRFAEADLRGVDFSTTNLRGADLLRADIRGVSVDDADIDREAVVGGVPPALDDADHYDALAKAYHHLKSVFSDKGIDRLARSARFSEKKARTMEAFHRRQLVAWVGMTLSRLLTGYGTRASRVLGLTALLFALTTAWYAVVPTVGGGWEGGSVYYSVVTLVTSPPHPPQVAGIVFGALTEAVVFVETYLGTALIILLGYVLSNRDRI
ncbi:pentapeptide repeat-containing protein [Halorubrum ejinorense]|uniref:Pentapeptide repeat-containing protein n=1 Tax=Halorubrum ejinorense TaxID=425309 RepID=A0AAV3SQ09_9EURY